MGKEDGPGAKPDLEIKCVCTAPCSNPSRPCQASLPREDQRVLYIVTDRNQTQEIRLQAPSTGDTLPTSTLRLTDEGKMKNGTFPQ